MRDCGGGKPRIASLVGLEHIAVTEQGIGARLLRKEDDRLLRGRGQFVADLRFAGMKDVAFARSPLAHARIRNITIPPALKGVAFTASDMTGVKPIRAVSGLNGFKVSEQPALAIGKVRFVGELVAMCVAPTRAEAEDIASAVVLNLDEIPAVYDMLAARDKGSALLHDDWGDNVFLETFVNVNIDKALDAPIKVTREIRTARQCMAPLEGKGAVAYWDTTIDQLGSYPRPRSPHMSVPAFPSSSDSRRPDPRHCARCRRRLRLQGGVARRKKCRRLARYASVAIRCAGPRIGASI